VTAAELESRKLAAAEYIRRHDKRVVQLDRLSVVALREVYRTDLSHAAQQLVYGGPVDKDEFIRSIIELEFPDIARVRETYGGLMAGDRPAL
jgi:hypothetical protein